MSAAALAALITVGISVLGAFIMLLMVNYLPDSPIESFIVQANGFWRFCSGLAFFVPVAEILAIMEVWVTVMWSVVVFKVVYELVNKIIE